MPRKTWLVAAIIAILATLSSATGAVAFETLDVGLILDLGEAFVYTNDLFEALAQVIYLVIGFQMFKLVVNFVMRTIGSFSF